MRSHFWLAFCFAALSLSLACKAEAQDSASNSPTLAPSSQPTSPLGPADYQTFLVDLAIAKARFQSSQAALQAAEQQNSVISGQLSKAQAQLDLLQQQQSTQAQSSTQSSEQVSQEVATLTRQLQDSQTTVANLRKSLASAGADLQAKLDQAQAKAAALEAENSVLKIGCITFGVGLGAVAVYEAGHLLKVW